jgi:hypothetical protein
VEEFKNVSNTFRKHNPTSAIFNHYEPIGGHFGGLVTAIETKTALVNG